MDENDNRQAYQTIHIGANPTIITVTPSDIGQYSNAVWLYFNNYTIWNNNGESDAIESINSVGETIYGSWYPLTFQPTITKQPVITSISPTYGTSTTVSWDAATVINQGSATIYYQYFVGPSSTYSDSYHVGTTTGLSATITESDILNKCGSGFDGTCYLFVRAYWQDGSTTGGWTTPTGSAFTYTAHRTVSYHDGSGWVECIVYYHDGSGWVECVPYYYSGGWIECSNS